MTTKSQAVILMLASNPRDTSPIQLDEEAREIRMKLREANLRHKIRLETYWAVRPTEILQALNQHEPNIVHFSGHGSERSELVVSAGDGTAHRVAEKALVTLFDGANPKLQSVVLNSCFSAGQASSIAEHVGLAVGMSAAIGNQAAIVFSGAFYSALGYSKSYSEALRQAKASLLLHGIDEENIPTLFSRSGVDPRATVLAGLATKESKSLTQASPQFNLEAHAETAQTILNQQGSKIDNNF